MNMHAMHDDEGRHENHPEREMAKSLAELEATQNAILERFGGALSERQKESITNLLAVDHSLHGPEEQIIESAYNRAFPPQNTTTTTYKPKHSKLDQ
jgi:hypothetical protein